MKQVDLSSSQGSTSQFSQLQSLLRQALRGSGAKAQDTLARLFSSGLNNHFVLVRNLVIPDETEKTPGFLIPCVLLGPACLLVINPSDLQGFFRAQEDSWLQMEKHAQTYRPASHNLIRETLLMAEQVHNLMQAGGLPYPEVQPVLFFANTGMHVESARPAVRILKFDTVERFLSSLRREEPLLDARQVQVLVDYLTGLEQASQAQKSRAAEKPKKTDRLVADQAITTVETIIDQQHLNRKQWLILGGLLTATIVTLIILILVVLFLA